VMLFALVGGSNAVIKLGGTRDDFGSDLRGKSRWPDSREISNFNQLIDGCISKVLFPVGENRRHSRRLGWGAPVSGRQVSVFRSVRGGFWAPVSARHFSISISAGRRPVRLLNSQSALRVTGAMPARSPWPRRALVCNMQCWASWIFYCGFAASHCVAATNDAGINRRCYNENPILCSCSAHEYGSALARPVTVRSGGAVPSTIAATMRGGRNRCGGLAEAQAPDWA
jgi:hypothetical protein